MARPAVTVAIAALVFAAACAFAATKDAQRPGDAPAASAEERLKRNQVTRETAAGDEAFRADQKRGLTGDAEAALRVAQMYRNGSNGVARDEKRMIQWLLHASRLDSGPASYQLYLYYLDKRLDRDAVFFEKRALEQGYVPPPRLDPRRG